MLVESPAITITPLRRLFPLHLSTFESLLLADDRAGYPMTFACHLTLRGQIDRAAWEAATDAALDRHPLLRAQIAPGKRGAPCWILAKEPRPWTRWQPWDAPLECPQGEPIDLATSTGLRVWVRQGDERAVVTMQFHHACCDGIGAYRFMGDLLALYGLRTCTGLQRPPELSPLDPALYRLRTRRALEFDGGEEGMRRRLLGETWRLLGLGAAPLAAPRPIVTSGLPWSDFPGLCTLSFDRQSHEHLRDVASSQGGTLNDLLLRDLFLAMRDWNGRRRRGFGPRRLRIAMPTDLRTTQDYAMPAANMTSYAFLTRPEQACDDPAALLRGIRDETALVKHNRSGVLFLRMVGVSLRVPGLLPWVLARRRCLASAVMSNVGDPSRRFTARLPREGGLIVAGNLVLEDITGVPPYRPQTRATFSVFQYARRLTLCLRCDPSCFALDDTRELLELMASKLRLSAGRDLAHTDGAPPLPASFPQQTFTHLLPQGQGE